MASRALFFIKSYECTQCNIYGVILWGIHLKHIYNQTKIIFHQFLSLPFPSHLFLYYLIPPPPFPSFTIPSFSLLSHPFHYHPIPSFPLPSYPIHSLPTYPILSLTIPSLPFLTHPFPPLPIPPFPSISHPIPSFPFLSPSHPFPSLRAHNRTNQLEPDKYSGSQRLNSIAVRGLSFTQTLARFTL